MSAQPHNRHHEEKHDHEEKDSGDRVIAHAARAFEPYSFLVIAIHPATKAAIGAIPIPASTRSAAKSANR